MIQASHLPAKKRRRANIEFSIDDPVPKDHVGTEHLIIKAVVGKSLVHRIYVDNGSSANIIYSHCLSKMPPEIQEFTRLPTSSVVGFAGQAVWPEGKISLPFTLVDYTGCRRKTVLADFIVIRATSQYNMLLGRTGLWQLQAIASTIHGLLKYLTNEGVEIIRSIPIEPIEFNVVSEPEESSRTWEKGESSNAMEVHV